MAWAAPSPVRFWQLFFKLRYEAEPTVAPSCRAVFFERWMPSCVTL